MTNNNQSNNQTNKIHYNELVLQANYSNSNMHH